MDWTQMWTWLAWGLSRLARVRRSQPFWTSLLATLIGVFVAFELARWRERRAAREQYARHLSAVRYESAQLHAVCQQALAAIPGGGITTYDLDAPALRALVSDAALQEHAPHGLAIVLMSLLAFVGEARNRLEYYRALATAGYGQREAPALLLSLTRLQAGIEHGQGLIDRELHQRLKRGVVPTDQDRQNIAAFREATK